jgi:hypothetical protein
MLELLIFSNGELRTLSILNRKTQASHLGFLLKNQLTKT